MPIQRNPTRPVRIGTVTIGAGRPIAVQSMTATPTRDVAATVAQVNALYTAGADVVRIAVDSERDAEAISAIRHATEANLAVDLQENYRLAEALAPHVDKIRYNPGHLYHHQRDKPFQEKVRYLADVAAKNDCAIRVGVNCGSVDPTKKDQFDPTDSIGPMLASALEHCELLDSLGFTRYCVSLKDSNPLKVIDVNRRFAKARSDVPLHLGVTEAGMPPAGILKTRIALEQLISRGIGDTIRVSLTVSNDRKGEEIAAGRQILADIAAGRVRSVVDDDLNALRTAPETRQNLSHGQAAMELQSILGSAVRTASETGQNLSHGQAAMELQSILGSAVRTASETGQNLPHGQAAMELQSILGSALNIISCPSCSRVENEAFVELAEKVQQMTAYAKDHPITIAVMGCRVNGPGETDDADLGLWCGPNYVNLKRGPTTIGRFSYDEILPRLKEELDSVIAMKTTSASV